MILTRVIISIFMFFISPIGMLVIPLSSARRASAVLPQAGGRRGGDPGSPRSPEFPDTDPHQVLADNQFPGEVLLCLHQAHLRRIPGHDVVQDQGRDVAFFGDPPDIADLRVRVLHVGLQCCHLGPFGRCSELDVNPCLVDDLVDEDIGAIREPLQVALGHNPGVAREDDRGVRGIEPVGK